MPAFLATLITEIAPDKKGAKFPSGLVPAFLVTFHTYGRRTNEVYVSKRARARIPGDRRLWRKEQDFNFSFQASSCPHSW